MQQLIEVELVGQRQASTCRLQACATILIAERYLKREYLYT